MTPDHVPDGTLTRAPRVSVIVPTFNRNEALGRCLEGLFDQTYPKEMFEVVVVDDGGTVDLTPVVGRFRAPVDVKVVRQDNRGPAAARNLGGREATGKILAFTDDDCHPRPDWIARLVEALGREPWAMVGGPVKNALSRNPFAQASQDLVNFLYEYFPSSRSLRPFLTTNNVAVGRELFLSTGGFDPSFRFSAAEDRDLSERWQRDVGPLRFIDSAVVDHFHDMTFGGFLRQHHRYGRGAVNLARCRLRRGDGPPSPEPVSFYARMLAYPFRSASLPRGAILAFLVALAQVSGLTGMAAEFLWRSDRKESTSATR